MVNFCAFLAQIPDPADFSEMGDLTFSIPAFWKNRIFKEKLRADCPSFTTKITVDIKSCLLTPDLRENNIIDQHCSKLIQSNPCQPVKFDLEICFVC